MQELSENLKSNMSAKMARLRLIGENVKTHLREQAQMGYTCINVEIITGIEDDAKDAIKVARQVAEELGIELLPKEEAIIFRIPLNIDINTQEDGI